MFAMSTFKSCLRLPEKFYNNDQQDQLLRCILAGVTWSKKRSVWDTWSKLPRMVHCKEGKNIFCQIIFSTYLFIY